MAAVSLQLYTDPSVGTVVSLNYDDVTLVAPSVAFVAPQTLSAPLIVNVVINNMPLTFETLPNIQAGRYTFPTPLQGVAFTNFHGRTAIRWPWQSLQFGTLGNTPVIGNTVVQVVSNG